MKHIPDYMNVREVKMVTQGGSDYITCSCGGWNIMRLPCSCILSVVDKIDVTMCHMSWLKTYRNHYGTNTLVGRKLVEMQLKSRIHPGCLLTSPIGKCEDLTYPIFLRGTTSEEFQEAEKILTRSKSKHPIIYRGSLEQSMDKSDIQVEDSNRQEILAGMLEPTTTKSKETSILHDMLEKHEDVRNDTIIPDEIEWYKEMENSLKEMIRCVIDPSDVNFVWENITFMRKTLKERRADDAIAKDPTRSTKKLLSSEFETETAVWHKRLIGSHDYATKK